MKELNEEYIRKFYSKELLPDVIKKIIDTMKKYGDNLWWESEDLAILAFYQLFEDVFIVKSFSDFHSGIEILLDRPVWTHEFALNCDGLKEEAKQGLIRIKNNLGTSDEIRNAAVKRSFKMLENFCNKTGKTIIKFEI